MCFTVVFRLEIQTFLFASIGDLILLKSGEFVLRDIATIWLIAAPTWMKNLGQVCVFLSQITNTAQQYAFCDSFIFLFKGLSKLGGIEDFKTRGGGIPKRPKSRWIKYKWRVIRSVCHYE